MMFYKPLVSLTVAFAAASSVAAAAAAPEARGGTSCDVGKSEYCCTTVTDSKNIIVQATGIPLDANLLDGLGCTSIVSGGTW